MLQELSAWLPMEEGAEDCSDRFSHGASPPRLCDDTPIILDDPSQCASPKMMPAALSRLHVNLRGREAHIGGSTASQMSDLPISTATYLSIAVPAGPPTEPSHFFHRCTLPLSHQFQRHI